MTSARLTPAAATSTRTCPGRSSGSGTSSRTRLSASPGCGIVMARMGPSLRDATRCPLGGVHVHRAANQADALDHGHRVEVLVAVLRADRHAVDAPGPMTAWEPAIAAPAE